MKRFASLVLLCASLAQPLWAADNIPLRLPTSITPTAYQVALDVDPNLPTHRGEVRIALSITEGAQHIRLHGTDITVEQAVLRQGDHSLQAQAQALNSDVLDLAFERPFSSGKAELTIRFKGLIEDKDSQGLFRQKEGGDWYAFTQFESISARKAFPAFDEPGWKVPWTLSLTVPAHLTAVANTPLLREVALPKRADGVAQKRVEFQTTKPLPSYLLAFGVGPFDILDGGKVGPTPVRFITPKGRAQDASYAASITPTILQKLEAYFGQPYPYEKLDVMALPMTLSFGAMENPGLITFTMLRMLSKPGEETINFKRSYVGTQAHELAHQWFGNLVTMAWWDDLWLNESFASWLGSKITEQISPEMSGEDSVQGARAWAMGTDRLLSTSQIFQPVTDTFSQGDPLGGQSAAIVYGKGQVVLSMFETWMGEAAFRAGVQRYMQRHAWSNATGEDFVAALALDDADLKDAFRTFTHQPGIPRITARLNCTGAPVLELTQSRFLPQGVQDPQPRLWHVPITVRTPQGTARLLLKQAQGSLPLPGTQCPAWVQANVNGSGYYRTVYAPGALRTLMAQAPLSLNETLTNLNDAMALTESGDLPMSDALALAQQFAGHPRREISDAALNMLSRVEKLLTPADRPAYAKLWQAAFGAQARTLGLLNKPGENFEDQLRRGDWVERVADVGEDPQLRQQAQALAQQWLKDRKSLPSTSRHLVLRVAALQGDRAFFDALVAATQSSPDRRERADIYAALSNFRDPALAQAGRELALSPRHDIREVLFAGRSRGGNDTAKEENLAFITRHFDSLAQRLPAESAIRFPTMFSSLCTARGAEQMEGFFTPLLPRYEGMAQTLTQSLESIRLCAAYRDAQQASLQQALKAL